MVNFEIKAEYVVVVSNENDGIVEMKLTDAVALAEKTGEDVILLNAKGDKPVVKIGDYNKFLYEKQKKEKENRKKARMNSQETKEIRISDAIAQHDLEIKAKNADRMLGDGDKVMLVIRYKGRSIRFIEDGPSKLAQLENLISTEHKIEKTPKIEGNRVYMILAPTKK